ncbi:MAG: hypothetical protein HY722_09410 [Planctomycetes bacterium]|nr:hypothetical protein [Planctomycetota bacterium]
MLYRDGSLAAVLACALAAVPVAGCRTTRAITTYSDAFGDYNKVLDETIRVIDKYAFIMEVDRRAGRVIGEVRPDNAFFTKTRKLVYGEVYDRGGYYDVEVRVVHETDQSEADWHRNEYVAPYEWHHVSYDQQLEVKLTHEIKNALSGGEYDKKEALSVADAAEPEPAVSEEPAGHVALGRRLDSTKVTLNFASTDFAEAVRFFADLTGFNVVLDPAAGGVMEGARVDLNVKEVSARNALDLLLDAVSPELVWVIRDEVIFITGSGATREGAAGLSPAY